MSRADDYYTRQFRRADPDMVRDFYLHEADDHPAANEDDIGAFRGLLAWPCIASAGIVAAALVAVFWPH